MTKSVEIPESAAYEIPQSGCSATRRKPFRVFMMDLLSIVPYYDGHLCAALAWEDGVSVTLGAMTYQHDPDYFRREGVQNRAGLLAAVSNVPLPPPVRRVLKAAGAVLQMVILAAKFTLSPPDILHVQFLALALYSVPVEIWFMRFVRALGIKIVYTVHNVLPPDTGEGLRSIFRKIYSYPDLLICHDRCARDRLVDEFGVPAGKIRVISHGPLFQQALGLSPSEARARIGITQETCLVLWQGILKPYKGVTFLLKAWAEITANMPAARLAIVGNGTPQLMQEVRDDIASLGIEFSVQLDFRFIPIQDLIEWYTAADVLVYPYIEITTSGALMTGIHFGKAIVATALPAFQQILRHGENALLTDYGDVSGLAENLRLLITDEEIRRKLARKARELKGSIESWSAIAAETRQCYESVAEISSRPGPASGAT